MMDTIDRILEKLESHIRLGTYEQLESDSLELKPVPSDSGSWSERYKSACAFLNTRGGILILGIKEETVGSRKKFLYTGYRGDCEEKIRDLARGYTDRAGSAVELSDAFPPPVVKPFLDGQVVLIYIDELSADKKFVFFKGKAYKRILSGDVRVTDLEIESQEEYKENVLQARELMPVEESTLADVDLDQLNNYIQELNRPVKIETIKADIPSAQSFLERKKFVIGQKLTTLGMLVCGRNTVDFLGFRAQLHAYIDIPGTIAQDKQDYSGSVLTLMDSGFSYLLRNTYTGTASRNGGIGVPQYPEQLLRETVNNALAHRDYSINRHVIIAIRPGISVTIQNPGMFRKTLLLEKRTESADIRRIVPEAKPRNPRLADVLRVYRKWEGRGIGMATLVSLALENRIDVPYYILKSEEVALTIVSGKVLDDRMEWFLKSFDSYIGAKTSGRDLTESQKIVLAYLIKSEQANRALRYTINLSPDNNHFSDLAVLKKYGLVEELSASDDFRPIYLVDPHLMGDSHAADLYALFGESYASLHETAKDILNALYRFNNYSASPFPSAKQVSQFLWSASGRPSDIKEFDTFYRRVRYFIVKMHQEGLLEKQGPGYSLSKKTPPQPLL
ncbi:MAG: RNA-binding domain-containing protein [Treponemataceae bacterium]